MTESKPEKVVCVFCGSSFGNDPTYSKHASDLGRKIANKNWGLVYGGGTSELYQSYSFFSIILTYY